MTDQEDNHTIGDGIINTRTPLTLSAETRVTLKWLILFSAMMAAAYGLSSSEFFIRWINPLFISVQIKAASFILTIVGIAHEVQQTVITASSRQFVVAESCSGLFVFFLYTAAVISFPARIQLRIKGTAAGLAAILVLNVMRITMIITVGSRFPSSFWAFHIVAGQALVICGMAGTFLLWLRATTRRTETAAVSTFHKGIIRFVLLFALGYSGGYFLYILFLKSPVGLFISGLIQNHVFWFLKAAAPLFQSLMPNQHLPAISFVEGCLSSPVFVILFAVLIAWPRASWKSRLIICLLGYIPLFYVYHVARALVVVLSFASGTTRATSVMYNCYGQFVLAGVTVAAFWAYQFNTTRPGLRKAACQWLTGLTAGLITASAGGLFARHIIIPWVLDWLAKDAGLFHDPQLTLSTMAYFQLFVANTLVWSFPSPPAKRLVQSVWISLILVVAVAGTVVAIEGLSLTPHTGILKGLIMILPAALYYLFLGRILPRESA